ncbi:MAG: class II aldolase/adducin family protein [Caulobacterales bacterium]
MRATGPSAAQQEQVRAAARALAAAGLVHAFGHCSVRLSATHFLVCAAMPMGLIRNEPGAVVAIDGPLPDGVLGEVRAHQQIYARRADAGGVCRIMPPAVMALSTQGITPRPRHGLGAYFAPQPPLWDDPKLLRDDALAAALADRLGDAAAIVMRGNGAIVTGKDLPTAVTLSWFLEDSARVELAVRSMGADLESGLLSADEIAARQVFSGGVVERMWAHLTTPGARHD